MGLEDVFNGAPLDERVAVNVLSSCCILDPAAEGLVEVSCDVSLRHLLRHRASNALLGAVTSIPGFPQRLECSIA